MDKPQISLIPDTIFQLGPFAITSGHIAMFLITLTVFVISFYVSRTASLKPTRLQVVFEFLMTWFLEKVDFAFKRKEVARKVFPLIMTMFLVIVCANLFSLIPLVDAITFNNDSTLLRTPTSDISMTLALGVFAVVLSHVLALIKSPLRHIGRFINVSGFFKVRSFRDFMMALLDFVLGINDIIGEFAKMVSVSFRLFGNIFSGVAVAAVFAYLAPYLVPIPFFALGLFSGLIQSIVFALLAMQYLSSTLEPLEEGNS